MEKYQELLEEGWVPLEDKLPEEFVFLEKDNKFILFDKRNDKFSSFNYTPKNFLARDL